MLRNIYAIDCMSMIFIAIDIILDWCVKSSDNLGAMRKIVCDLPMGLWKKRFKATLSSDLRFFLARGEQRFAEEMRYKQVDRHPEPVATDKGEPACQPGGGIVATGMVRPERSQK